MVNPGTPPPPPPPEGDVGNEAASNATTGSTGETPPKAQKKQPRSGPAQGRSTHSGQRDLPLTPECEAIDQIEFRGNIIPHPWYEHLKTDSGKTDSNACMLLGEIVYWYRGSDVIENREVVGRKRKFHGDLLQMSYGDFERKFGFTKNQVRATLARLEAKGVIKRVFRTFVVRGMSVSNVLFIQIFPDKVREISFFRDETHTSPEKSGEGGSQKKNEEGAEQKRRGVENPPKRGGEFSGDKYTEYPKEDPREFRESRSTTSPSVKPGKPASSDSSSSQAESGMNAEDKNPEFKDNPQPGDESQEGRTEDCNSDQDQPGVDETDFDSIRAALESAFGGQTFTPHGEKKLKEYIAAGRITRTWVAAFARAKSVFDQDREAWKKRRVFIPFQPSYLFSQYDLTAMGVLEMLGDEHQRLRAHLDSFDEDICQKKYDGYKMTLDRYDRQLRESKCFDPGYSKWIAEAPLKRPNQVADLLFNPSKHSWSHYQDVVPPAWMRVHYAWFNKAYQWELIRSKMLAKAQEEIRQNPRIVKFANDTLKEAAIKSLFDLDFPSELQRCAKLSDRIDIELARLQDWIAVVGDCQCAGQTYD